LDTPVFLTDTSLIDRQLFRLSIYDIFQQNPIRIWGHSIVDAYPPPPQQVFLPEESVVQIVVALLISMAAFAFAAISRPFVDPTLDKLLLFGLATQVARLP